MNEMVERVAKALCSRSDSPDRIGTFDDGRLIKPGKPAWTAWEDDARAAIAAMREPTEEITRAGHGEGCWSPNLVWQAMIDAALKD